MKLSSGLLPCLLRHCFWILFEFQVIRKGCIFTRPRIANRRRLGTSQPLELYCTIGDYFSWYDLSFKCMIGKGCEGSGDDSWSDAAESLCGSDGNSNVKCGEVVSGKRCVAWNVTRDVGWTLGELSGWGWSVKLAEVSVSVDLFLQCPSQVAAESSLTLARRLVRIGEKVVMTCTQNINSIYLKQ